MSQVEHQLRTPGPRHADHDLIFHFLGYEHHVAVVSLVPPNMDAEEYQAKPQDVLRLRTARMIVRVGLDYDLWAERLLLQAGNSAIRRGGASLTRREETSLVT